MIKGVSKVAFNKLLTIHLILCKGVFSCSEMCIEFADGFRLCSEGFHCVLWFS